MWNSCFNFDNKWNYLQAPIQLKLHVISDTILLYVCVFFFIFPRSVKVFLDICHNSGIMIQWLSVKRLVNWTWIAWNCWHCKAFTIQLVKCNTSGMDLWIYIPGRGALNFFLGGCVPRGFQNVGSRERIFLKKMGVLGTKIWKILGLESSDFGQNIVENAKIF